jgi:hypothetical protein
LTPAPSDATEPKAKFIYSYKVYVRSVDKDGPGYGISGKLHDGSAQGLPEIEERLKEVVDEVIGYLEGAIEEKKEMEKPT